MRCPESVVIFRVLNESRVGVIGRSGCQRRDRCPVIAFDCPLDFDRCIIVIINCPGQRDEIGSRSKAVGERNARGGGGICTNREGCPHVRAAGTASLAWRERLHPVVGYTAVPEPGILVQVACSAVAVRAGLLKVGVLHLRWTTGY